MNNTITIAFNQPAKIFFNLFDCAPKFEMHDNAWVFTVENSNECFNALIITGFVLIFLTTVELIAIIVSFCCLAQAKNRIEQIDYITLNRAKIEPVKRISKARSLSSSSSPSSESSKSSSSETSSSDSESEVETKKNIKSKKHQSRKNKFKKEQKNEEKVSTIRLPRYTVYKPNEATQELVIEMNEKFKKQKKNKKTTDEDAFSLHEMKETNNKKRSKSKESRTSRHSSKGARKSKETRY